MSASLTPTPLSSELLTSWKEIAAYLGKGVRTVQRWEQLFGLPVRRPNDKEKGIVHATREELDRWLRDEWSQRAKELADDAARNGDGIERVRRSIESSVALRQANRVLLDDIRSSLASVFSECQVLARHLNGGGNGNGNGKAAA